MISSNAGNPYSQYKQTAVQTASPEKLILMLYEGGGRFLKQALAAIQQNDMIGANRHISKAQDVLGELIASINPEAGEMSVNLTNLYTYMNRRLIEANTKKDVEVVKEVLGMFQEFYDTWNQAINGTNGNQPAGGINIEG